MTLRKVFVLLLFALTLSLWAIPTSAQTGIDWTGQYYNNPYLLGEPAATINSNSLSYDWGAGSPASGIDADNFSVRWTTDAYFSGGTYRFYARADDKINVEVNFSTLISTFNTDNVGDMVTGEITLEPGRHQIQVNYREEGGNAYAYVSWANVASNPQPPNFAPIPSATPVASGTTTTTPIDITGWTAQYYGNNSLSGLPTAILSETAITRDWGEGSPMASIPADNFSARWTAPTTLDAGTYRVSVRADDGIRVFIDGSIVIDRWQNFAGSSASVDVNLSAGSHNFAVEYNELTGNAYIDFNIARVVQGAAAPTATAVSVVQPGAPANTGATGTINIYRLNVRNAPTTEARVIAKVEDGETYPIIGRNADTSWWQIDVNGLAGWVYSDFVVDANSGSVPITSNSSQVGNIPGTGYFATATATVNLRSEPSRGGAILGQIPRGGQAEITGRNIDGTWIQVNYNGTVSWVSNLYLNLPLSTSDIPPA